MLLYTKNEYRTLFVEEMQNKFLDDVAVVIIDVGPQATSMTKIK